MIEHGDQERTKMFANWINKITKLLFIYLLFNLYATCFGKGTSSGVIQPSLILNFTEKSVV